MPNIEHPDPFENPRLHVVLTVKDSVKVFQLATSSRRIPVSLRFSTIPEIKNVISTISSSCKRHQFVPLIETAS
jgi:hypothetical protein